MSDRRWCARCSRQLPDGWDAVICSCGYLGMTYNAPQNDVSTLAKLMRGETDRVAKQVLNREYAKLVEESFVKPRPLMANTTVSSAYIPANTTIDTFIHISPKKENDMNVRAAALPTVGGHRAVVVRQGRVEMFDSTGDEVLWESAKVYKNVDKAKAAAERRIADGLKVVFG